MKATKDHPPVLTADGGELTCGTLFYALADKVPDEGADPSALRVLPFRFLQPDLVRDSQGLIAVGAYAIGGALYPLDAVYLDERRAVAAALADTRGRLADLARREAALAEQARRLGLDTGDVAIGGGR